MDFGKELMEAQGHGTVPTIATMCPGHQLVSAGFVLLLSSGNYECMDASKLPQLWLAYLADPSDSGMPS